MREKDRGPQPATFKNEDLKPFMDTIRHEEATKDEKEKKAEKEYWTGRKKLIGSHFQCPICSAESYSVSMAGHVHGKSTGGVIMDYIHSATDGFICDNCTTKFGDPARYTSQRDELAEALKAYDAKNKPAWLKKSQP